MKGKKKKSEAEIKIHNELLKVIGKKLMKRRKELGYTNADTFTYDKQINRSQYGKYEAGSTDMRLSTLAKILRLLDLKAEEFFKEDHK